MSEDNVQATEQENQETQVENKPESPSNDGLLSEVMAKKATIKEQAEEIAQLKAANEKRRTKKLEDEGRHKELIAELKAPNEKQAIRLEKPDKMEMQLKVDIINSLTSDDSKREELATKDIETLRFIQNEIGNRPVNNPQESLGSVRSNPAFKDFNKLTDQEKRDHWPEIVASMKQ